MMLLLLLEIPFIIENDIVTIIRNPFIIENDVVTIIRNPHSLL